MHRLNAYLGEKHCKAKDNYKETPWKLLHRVAGYFLLVALLKVNNPQRRSKANGQKGSREWLK